MSYRIELHSGRLVLSDESNQPPSCWFRWCGPCDKALQTLLDGIHLIALCLPLHLDLPHFTNVKRLDDLLSQFGRLEGVTLNVRLTEYTATKEIKYGFGQIVAENLPLTRQRCELNIFVESHHVSWRHLFTSIEEDAQGSGDFREDARAQMRGSARGRSPRSI